MITGLFVLSLFNTSAFCQSWSKQQLDAANTAKDISYLSKEEKEIVLYINLARLYPKAFVQSELRGYKGFGNTKFVSDSSYKVSLIKELNNLQPSAALIFDAQLYGSAKCFSDELAAKGTLTHIRVKCAEIPMKSLSGECIAEGLSSGRDLALTWLIDNGLPNLGHRKNCLDPRFVNIGVSNTVKNGDTFSVADLNR